MLGGGWKKGGPGMRVMYPSITIRLSPILKYQFAMDIHVSSTRSGAAKAGAVQAVRVSRAAAARCFGRICSSLQLAGVEAGEGAIVPRSRRRGAPGPFDLEF